MCKRIFIICYVAVGLIFGHLTAFSSTVHLSNSASDLVETVMSKLVAGDFQGAVGQIHEPATYDRERAAEDRRSLGEDLVFLFKEFGNVSSPRLAQSSVVFDSIEIAGGDVPYWQSLRNSGVAATATYLVDFSRVGPGVIVITLTKASGMWELRSIRLGLEQSRPHSRETMLRISQSFLQRGIAK